jgi:hypothetical protein
MKTYYDVPAQGEIRDYYDVSGGPMIVESLDGTKSWQQSDYSLTLVCCIVLQRPWVCQRNYYLPRITFRRITIPGHH